jgi:hypothetical protein
MPASTTTIEPYVTHRPSVAVAAARPVAGVVRAADVGVVTVDAR